MRIFTTIQQVEAYSTYCLLLHHCLVQNSTQDVADDGGRVLDSLADRYQLVHSLLYVADRVAAADAGRANETVHLEAA